MSAPHEPAHRCYRCGRPYALAVLSPGLTCPRCQRNLRRYWARQVREEDARLRYQRNYGAAHVTPGA